MTAEPTLSRRSATLLLAGAAASLAAPRIARAQEKTVRVLRSPVGAFQPLYIAQDQGYFKEKGLKVEIAVGGAPTQNIAQLQAGQTDVIMTGAFDLVAGVAQGLPLAAVINAQDQGAVPTTGLLVPGNSSIKTVADLKGKSVGIPGIQSIQGLMVYRALEKAGVNRNDVKLVNLPFEAVVESGEKGNVDAIVPAGLFFSLAQSKGFVEIKEAYATIQGTPAVIFGSSNAWLAANGPTMTAFNEAMQKAYVYGNANPDAVRAIDSAQTRMPPDYIKTRFIAPFVAGFQRDKWNAAVADMARFGFIPKTVEEAKYIWSGAPA